MLIWKIAWRNVWRHKGKSVVIGLIMFLGALLMTVGNATVKGAKQNLQVNLVQRLTGDLILVNGQEDPESLFFSGRAAPLKLIPNYPDLKHLLEDQEMIEHLLPMNRGGVMILNEEGGPAIEEWDEEAGTILYGIDVEEYQETFDDNIIPVEGVLLKQGERGVLITERNRKEIYDQYHLWVVPQGFPLVEEHLPPEALAAKDRLRVTDNLVFLGLSGESLESDIRVPVKGIVRLRDLNAIWRNSFIDSESFRRCFGYLPAAHKAVTLTEEQAALIEADNEDELFAGDTQVTQMEAGMIEYDVAAMQQQTQRADLPVDTDEGAYQFVLVKLKPGMSVTEGAERLRRILADAQADIKVLTWQRASGSVAQFAMITQGVLLVFVLFIFFVAAIVIMNTLSMAAIERTTEIGMMRALGARKGFIGTMFLAEIAVLFMLFGGLGMLTGVFVVWGLAALQLSTSAHELICVFAGGDMLRPAVDITGLLFGIGQLTVVALLTALYPIRITRRISPLEAIARD